MHDVRKIISHSRWGVAISGVWTGIFDYEHINHNF